MPMLRTLSARLTISHVAVALMSVALVTYGSSVLFARSHTRSIEHRLVVTSEAIAEQVATPLADMNREAIALISNAAGQVLGGRVCVLDGPSMALIATSDAPPTDSHRPEELIGQANLNASSLEVIDVECSGLTYTITVPIRHPSTAKPIGVLLVHAPVREYELTSFVQRTVTLLAGLAAALVAVILGALVARSLAQPIERITRSARALAGGDFDQKIEPTGPSEVQSLGGALNWASSELQRAFRTLSGERERLADLLASMSEGVVGVDSGGRVVVANQRAVALLGLPSEPLNGRDLDGLVEDPEVREALIEGTGDGCLARGNHLLRINTATLSGEGGFVAVISDVTETERTEQMRTDLIANASHQLRSPLMSIQGFLQAIADGTAESEPQRAHCLSVALEQVALLSRRVDKLLQLSKLQASQEPADPHDVLLGELACRACQHIQPQAEARSVRIEFHDCNPPAWVSGDADLLLEAVHNILDNAIRHSPEGSTITVATQRTDGEVRLSVADNGPGFPATDANLLWRRFYSGQRNGAAGLGLAITQEIVRTHFGRVWAEPNPRGGAIFGFVLPVREPATAADNDE